MMLRFDEFFQLLNNGLLDPSLSLIDTLKSSTGSPADGELPFDHVPFRVHGWWAEHAAKSRALGANVARLS